MDRNMVYFLAVLLVGAHAGTLLEHLGQHPDLSEFYEMLQKCEICTVSLSYESMTIFAPKNVVFQLVPRTRLEGISSENIVQYHMTNIPKRIEQLGTGSINSKVTGSLPLWITQTKGVSSDGVYVNNAKIEVPVGEYQFKSTSSSGKSLTYILYKIDDVLIPTIPKAGNAYNPTAWDFLENNEYFLQNPHRIRTFREQVERFGKQDVFKTEGGHTFFIPVDEGFTKEKVALMDKHVIDGHVIPKEVLFTTPAKKDYPFPTSANSDNDLRVVVYLTQVSDNPDVVDTYVKSHTLFSSGKHRKGMVLAKIVRANIPVKNGVIHLIHKPLIVVDSTVKQLLEDKDSKPLLGSFISAIEDAGDAGKRLLRTLDTAHEVTLFAPCNSALDERTDGPLNAILRDKARFYQVLTMHVVVDQAIYVDTVVQRSRQGVFQAPTENKFKHLYFSVGPNKTLTVEGGGVNATVIQQDIAAKNGIIHVIDRVLGVPSSNVLQKLANETILSKSYYLGNKHYFNAQLNSTEHKFTYFVPRNEAWESARKRMPSAIKKLFMDDYAYHATSILQRHLVIGDVAYTMQRIKQMTNDSSFRYDKTISKEVELPSVRDTLKLYVEESAQTNTYVIHWKGMVIPVFRPNVECTNGVIHIIDEPFLLEGDITVNGALKAVVSPLTLILVCVLFFFE